MQGSFKQFVNNEMIITTIGYLKTAFNIAAKLKLWPVFFLKKIKKARKNCGLLLKTKKILFFNYCFIILFDTVPALLLMLSM